MAAALALITVDDLAARLGPIGGGVRGEDAVRKAAEALGLRGPFSQAEAEMVLDRIVAMGGPAALAARLARAKGSLDASAARGSMPSFSAVSVISRADLVELLAPSLGVEASETLVGRFSERVGFPLAGERDAALKVLELMACETGVVGVAARFAKVKLILK